MQCLIADAVARFERVPDEKIAADVKKNIGDVPFEKITAVITQFQDLKAKAVKEFSRMRWGASGSLDDIKVARFAFDAAQLNRDLDEIAVRDLLKLTWYYLNR